MKKILAILLLLPALAFAWQPERPVTVIIGFAPGSGNELAFRKASDIVQRNNPGVTFIVENKPGADTVVATNQFVQAQPDGYTISVPSHMSHYVTNDIWQRDVKRYEWNSLINVITLGKSPLAVVASSRSVITDPTSFYALLRMGYRPVNIAIGGGAHQMAFEFMMAQVNGNREQIKLIKYQGPLQAVTAVAGNQVEFGIMPIAVARPLLEAGKIKLVGLTSDHPLTKMPGAPHMSRDFPGINVNAGWMISLPLNTHKEVVQWYEREFARAITSPEYQSWADDNLIYTARSELTVIGVEKYGQELKNTFKNIHPSE
jgi:tripartite-type tricarboxylate transporter receptor subunit TctC